ncbi:hypothetical protein CCAX7_57820 [Capsulimonas corticalis]|uniref:Uncharacterized protein n=1 Tax=Capsulimonas corticalis TaxID=2219043 RepID=A0A9N7QGN1_9BACT|nr:hypothetical protein [Capsulimonas corticalis]BDI33731.1 hypothetical protein CCAX7_57820 [Capsulimonas corticalis]
MFAKDHKAASRAVAAQTLVCVLAAGFVLTHFHHHPATGHTDNLLFARSEPRPLAMNSPELSQQPVIVLDAGAIIVPMTGVGPGPEGTMSPGATKWRIVKERGRTAAWGYVPSDVNLASHDGGFTVRYTHRVLNLYGAPTHVLSVQALGDPARLVGRYALEQADGRRPVFGRFEVIAPR